MTVIRSLLLTAAISALALPATAQKVTIEFDKEFDFSTLQRYKWREHPLVEKYPEVKEYTVAAQLIQSDVNENLMGRNYVPVEGTPDFYVTYFIVAKSGQDVRSVSADGFYPSYAMWPGSWYAWPPYYFTPWETVTTNYVQGIMLLDFVDAKTNKLIWRAVVKSKIEDMKTRHEKIAKAVTKSLKSFPPKGAKK